MSYKTCGFGNVQETSQILTWYLQVVFLANIVLSLVLVDRGQGKHIWELPPDIIPTFALPGRITSTFQVVSLAWSKTSFAITLLRVVPQKLAKWFLYFAMLTLNATLAVGALLPWISCVPLRRVNSLFFLGGGGVR